jgi:hypothetical protein
MQSKQRTGMTEDLKLSLNSTDIKLEEITGNILATPSQTVPPLNEWAALFAAADTSAEPELADWDITLQDGLNGGLV